MSDAASNLELSDEQREEVRRMLSQFSNQKAKKKNQQAAQKRDHEAPDIDPLEVAKPGTTIEWTELTPKTRRYTFVRETRAFFAPLMYDKVAVTKEELHSIIDRIGMDISSENNALIVCAVTQGDPVRVFQIQIERTEGERFLINTIRYIV
jgi:hypothetical protein